MSGISVLVKPTEGAYQKPKNAVIVSETKNFIKVSVDGIMGHWVFSKKDMLRTGLNKTEFPRWKLCYEQ